MGMMAMAMPHPFHVHTGQFQILRRSGVTHAGYVDDGWKDTVLVMPGCPPTIRDELRAQRLRHAPAWCESRAAGRPTGIRDLACGGCKSCAAAHGPRPTTGERGRIGAAGAGIEVACRPGAPMSQGPSPSTVRDRFLHDHLEIEDLFEGLLDAFEANDREGVAEIWAIFETRLAAHMEAEERMLLPFARSNPRQARALFEEHRHIRARIAELSCSVDLHTIGLPAARAFVDEIRAHARQEDHVLYGWADEHVGDAAKRSLLEMLAAPFQGNVRRSA